MNAQPGSLDHEFGETEPGAARWRYGRRESDVTSNESAAGAFDNALSNFPARAGDAGVRKII